MQDTNLFETMLGMTAPWRSARVEVTPDEKRVDVWLEHEATRWPCPNCGAELAGFDHAEERPWRHLDTCQCQTHRDAEIVTGPVSGARRQTRARAPGRSRAAASPC